jgi:integrase
MTLTEILREFKPLVTDSTIKSYTQNLNKLMKNLETTDFKILEKNEKVLKAIETLSPLSQRNVLNAVIVYLQAVKGNAKSIAKYVEVRDKHNEDYQTFTKTNKKSEKQEKNWITEEELNGVLEYWKSFDIQKYTLLKLLMAIPLRNDMRDMQIMTYGKYMKMSDEDKKGNNYFLKKQKTLAYFFALNRYKTAGTYGQKIIEIDASLNKEIGAFLRKSGHTSYLFTKKSGAPFSSIEFSKYVNSIFKKTGKNISTTMIRHMMATISGGEALKKQKELADNMGHSLGQNTDYIKID